jgi:hypothetical protein
VAATYPLLLTPMLRSAGGGGSTSVIAVAVLFAGAMSIPWPVTVAVFTSGPVAVGRTVIVRVTRAPGARLPRSNRMLLFESGVTPPAANGALVAPAPAALLAAAKDATGGRAWDGLRTQHSRVRIDAGNREATAERWASVLTGRSRMRLDMDGTVAVTAFDGFVPWSQQGNGPVSIDADPLSVALAINAAYRDRLAFWFPERQGARMEYAGRETADGKAYDVVAITPEGGRRYELWIDAGTHRIERLREPEYSGVRTEIYSDFRDVQGVKVPFAVQVTREDARFNEHYVVELLEYNVSLDAIEFSPPRPPGAPR